MLQNGDMCKGTGHCQQLVSTSSSQTDEHSLKADGHNMINLLDPSSANAHVECKIELCKLNPPSKL